MLFTNRNNELNILNRAKSGLYVLFGRRRVGKTTLVEHWGEQKRFYYSQAIEANESVQISQLVADLREILPPGIVPRDWSELFGALSLIQEPLVIAIDEFPYLVNSNSALPSMLQRWLDHNRPADLTLVILGSSQTMMHGLFLESSSPLYERATEILQIEPMGYRDFCAALNFGKQDLGNFELFSLVGGVPKYWEFIEPNDSAELLADRLYFQRGARLESEPDRLLKDEQISGQQAKSIFEAIGRGSHRPSEIAARLQSKQTTLSKPLQILRNTNLIKRESPFPDSSAESKRSLYKISDFALRFWYQTYSIHRSRWHLYSSNQRQLLIHEHAASVLEDCYRSLFPDARRYWEKGDLEIDCVRYNPDDLNSVIVTEIKNRQLSKADKTDLAAQLRNKFNKSSLAKSYKLAALEVLGADEVLVAV